jgi:transposase
MERRKFTREFKLEAVKLIRDRGVSYAQASQDLRVHPTQLRNWVRAFAEDPQHAFPGQGQMKPEQLEIARLKREVTKLKAERRRQGSGQFPCQRSNLWGQARVARHAGGRNILRAASH